MQADEEIAVHGNRIALGIMLSYFLYTNFRLLVILLFGEWEESELSGEDFNSIVFMIGFKWPSEEKGLEV